MEEQVAGVVQLQVPAAVVQAAQGVQRHHRLLLPGLRQPQRAAAVRTQHGLHPGGQVGPVKQNRGCVNAGSLATSCRYFEIERWGRHPRQIYSDLTEQDWWQGPNSTETSVHVLNVGKIA